MSDYAHDVNHAIVSVYMVTYEIVGVVFNFS